MRGLFPIGVVEQTRTASEEQGNDMKIHFVEESSLQLLLGNVRATAE
jgi:hypothetical protein